jgi:hypothetical protein
LNGEFDVYFGHNLGPSDVQHLPTEHSRDQEIQRPRKTKKVFIVLFIFIHYLFFQIYFLFYSNKQEITEYKKHFSEICMNIYTYTYIYTYLHIPKLTSPGISFNYLNQFEVYYGKLIIQPIL